MRQQRHTSTPLLRAQMSYYRMLTKYAESAEVDSFIKSSKYDGWLHETTKNIDWIRMKHVIHNAWITSTAKEGFSHAEYDKILSNNTGLNCKQSMW